MVRDELYPLNFYNESICKEENEIGNFILPI